MTATEEIKKGLAGVVVDYTAVSKVNPETNSLLYRGYPVQDLAANKSFEEVALLLWNGELPTPSELTEFSAFERANRALDPRVKAAIDLLPTDCHPMDVGRTAVSVIGANHPQAENSSPRQNCSRPRNCSQPSQPSSPTTSAAAAARSQLPRARTWITRPTSCG